MNYTESIAYLFSQLPFFQRQGKAAYKADLYNMQQLDAVLGHPHKKFRSIHVAGTNGKGSSSHLLAAVLQAQGYKTGLFTSPHLKDFRERIRINGQPIAEQAVVDFVATVQTTLSELKPSFFEATTAMAFKYFADEQVDIAIIETGLGGRLDSTNVIDPLCAVITNIGLDHTQFLGDSLAQIAGEKAGIVKPNTPVVIGEFIEDTKPVFLETAKSQNAPIYFAQEQYQTPYALMSLDGKQQFNFYKGDTLAYAELQTDLLGNYQLKNSATVLMALDVLQTMGISISRKAIYTGFAQVSELTGLRGRWQIIGANPRTVADVAHNEDGIKQIVAQLAQTPYQKLHMVWGMVGDKDISAILPLLPKEARYYFTAPDIPRALPVDELAKHAAQAGLQGNAYANTHLALQAARQQAHANDMIYIGGSTFVVAELIS